MPALSDRIRAEVLPPLGRAWRWWSGELVGLWPKNAGLGFARTPRADIRPGRDAVDIVRTADGQGERFIESRPLSAFGDDNWQEVGTLLAGHRARLLLGAPLAHIVTLRLPKAARPYLRTAVPLQLAEHAPLPLDHLEWKTVDTRLEGETLLIRVALVRSDVLEAIESGFRTHAIAQPPIFAETGDGKVVPLRQTPGGGSLLPRPWAWAAGILALTPFLLLLVLHILVVHERSRVSDAEELARPKLAAERRIRERAEVAHGLNRILAAPAVTSLVEDLADRLPSSAHATHIAAHDDGSIDVTLTTSDADRARAALAGDTRLLLLGTPDITQSADGSTSLHFEARTR
jgi:hypothetical protein